VALPCGALGVSRTDFRAWLTLAPSQRARDYEVNGTKVRASDVGSYRAEVVRRVWRNLRVESISCGLYRIDRLMQAQGLLGALIVVDF